MSRLRFESKSSGKMWPLFRSRLVVKCLPLWFGPSISLVSQSLIMCYERIQFQSHKLITSKLNPTRTTWSDMQIKKRGWRRSTEVSQPPCWSCCSVLCIAIEFFIRRQSRIGTGLDFQTPPSLPRLAIAARGRIEGDGVVRVVESWGRRMSHDLYDQGRSRSAGSGCENHGTVPGTFRQGKKEGRPRKKSCQEISSPFFNFFSRHLLFGLLWSSKPAVPSFTRDTF